MKRSSIGRMIGTVGAVLSVCVLFSGSADAFPGETTLVSVSSGGQQGNNNSGDQTRISADGRFVVFLSKASNLVAGDGNSFTDLFVHDRFTGNTDRVNVATDNSEANSYDTSDPTISADGRFVAFASYATNLVPNDTNSNSDVFIRDLLMRTTTRVSVVSDGTQANGYSGIPSISADGRYVAFMSRASNLVANDNNGFGDIFVHDRLYATTTRVSVGIDNTQTNGDSAAMRISADGRFVVFASYASNLVVNDNNGLPDLFLHDQVTGDMTLVTVAFDGTQSNGYNHAPEISADGRFVAFMSFASNLVAGDTNGQADVFIRDLRERTTTRVSVASDGTQVLGGAESSVLGISRDGRYVIFQSQAQGLVPEDTNFLWDIFVRDTWTGITKRVNIDSLGNPAEHIQGSGSPAISGDGRYVVFATGAPLVVGDSNLAWDVFVHQPEIAWYKGELLNANFDADILGGEPATFPRGLPTNDRLVSSPSGWFMVVVQPGAFNDNSSFRTAYVKVVAPCCGGGLPGTGSLDAYPNTTDNYVSGIFTASWQSAARQTNISDDYIILYQTLLDRIGVIRYGPTGISLLHGGGETFAAPYVPYIPQNFSVIVDLDNLVFDLSIDGVRVVTGAPFLNPVKAFSRIRFGAGVMDNTATHTIDVDNIRMYRGGDSDGDGVADSADICPSTYNPDQSDTDGDGLGDACDNCPGAFNPDQRISFADFGDGDACNTDVDQDGFPDKDSLPDGTYLPDVYFTPRLFYGIIPVNRLSPLDGGDNCPMRMNDQTDGDGDGVGNECDNCKFAFNPDQADSDGDTYGDVCDPLVTPSGAPPKTGGGSGGGSVNCDVNSDNDNICTSATETDICPSVYNPKVSWTDIDGIPQPISQKDTDHDGYGDECDTCPSFRNLDQKIPVWYKDGDGDGWADLSVLPVTSCSRPQCTDCTGGGGYRHAGELHSILTTDCGDPIDVNASVNPGLPEDPIDPADNDCNPDTPAVATTYEIRFSTSVNYDTWLPTGDPGSGGTVIISATVVNQGGVVQAVTPSLTVASVTSYPGRYTNDPATANVETDYTVPANPLGSITVTSRDFGGSVTISGSATVGGVPVRGTFRLPKDSNRDGLPDAWVALYPGVELVPEGDIDASVGNYFQGDGLTNFEEYRGFKWERLVAVDLAQVAPKYQTAAFVPEGTRGHFRTDPTRKDLFLAYTGYVPPAADPRDPNNTTFAIGAAFDDAWISVHATDNQYVASLGDTKIDVLLITHDRSLSYKGFDGRINKLGTRNWEWDTKGMTDTRGTSASYGANCTTGHDPLTKYFDDRPYSDLAPKLDGKLNPPNEVDDTNDDGQLTRADTEITGSGWTRSVLEGDYFLRFTYNLQLSPVNIDSDQFVELDTVLSLNPESPDYANGANPGPKEYSRAQVLKHTITHELGHAVGIPHNDISDCLMSSTSSNWKRDGYFSSSTDQNGVFRDAKSWIFIHND